jgi:hypothetical protein
MPAALEEFFFEKIAYGLRLIWTVLEILPLRITTGTRYSDSGCNNLRLIERP